VFAHEVSLIEAHALYTQSQFIGPYPYAQKLFIAPCPLHVKSIHRVIPILEQVGTCHGLGDSDIYKSRSNDVPAVFNFHSESDVGLDVIAHIILATIMKSIDWHREAVDALTYVVTLLLPTKMAIVETKTLMASIVLGLVVIFTVSYSRSPWRKLPPGCPRCLPILGNILQLRDKTWMLSKDYKERFGEVMYLNGAGQPIVVCNSLKPAFELLERRSGNYSDRPRFVMAQEILSGGLLFSLMNHDDR